MPVLVNIFPWITWN